MEAHFSPDVMAGLRKARMADAEKKNRLRVHEGDLVHPVLKIWEDGFSMDADEAPHLRGLVDLYDGARHLQQCLVIHSEVEAGVMNYEFKRHTMVSEEAPKDYAVDANAPVALIGR